MLLSKVGGLLRRWWKMFTLLFALCLMAPMTLAIVRFNITPERSKPLSALQRFLGFNQPAAVQTNKRPAIIGHRGSDGGRENTVRAIDHAIAAEVDWIEFDIRQCRGGELVVLHDETIDRWLIESGITGYKGKERAVEFLSYDELRAIQGPCAPGDQLLSLRQLFEHFPASGGTFRWLLDVKVPHISEEIISILGDHGYAPEAGRVIVQGTFDIVAEYKVSGYALAYAAGWTKEGNRIRYLFGNGFIVTRCEKLGPHLAYLTLPEMFLNAGLIREVTRKVPDIEVWTYFGSTPSSWRKSIDFGADGLIVDDVHRAVAEFRF